MQVVISYIEDLGTYIIFSIKIKFGFLDLEL